MCQETHEQRKVKPEGTTQPEDRQSSLAASGGNGDSWEDELSSQNKGETVVPVRPFQTPPLRTPTGGACGGQLFCITQAIRRK